LEAANRSKAQQIFEVSSLASGLNGQAAADRSRPQQVLAPYKQEVARSSRAPPILTRAF
jgi:hypothetical protein